MKTRHSDRRACQAPTTHGLFDGGCDFSVRYTGIEKMTRLYQICVDMRTLLMTEKELKGGLRKKFRTLYRAVTERTPSSLAMKERPLSTPAWLSNDFTSDFCITPASSILLLERELVSAVHRAKKEPENKRGRDHVWYMLVRTRGPLRLWSHRQS